MAVKVTVKSVGGLRGSWGLGGVAFDGVAEEA